MKRTFRFVAALLVALGLLAWGASVLVQRTTRRWFEKDIALRAELAARGARLALADRWNDLDQSRLRGLLVDLSRDERVMATAACDPDGRLRAATPDFPAELDCNVLAARLERLPDAEGEPGGWRGDLVLRSGEVHASAMPVVSDGRLLGHVVMLHDLSYVARRDRQTQLFLLLAFAILAGAAALATVLAARWSWRGFSDDLRRLLRGDGEDRPEFRPLLADLRELAARLDDEAEVRAQEGQWTAERLKQTLQQHLRGDRVLIVSNREPYIHVRGENGAPRVLHPASGLVTALEPVMRACSGVWIAHGSGSADRETVDAHDRVTVPPGPAGEPPYTLRRVWLDGEEEKGYYYGFSNEGLWPLCHVAHTRPVFRSGDWEHYRAINERFARAVADEVVRPDPIVLVQDYHLALAPRLIRKLIPRATIILFWHIPWPNAERFGICPWEQELLDGMLGASIVGFHTQGHCNNFFESVDRYLEARIDRERNAVVREGCSTLVRPYPISIEWPSLWARRTPAADECRKQVFAELGLRDDALLGVGVDRLDYTKGIEERLAAVERLLELRPDLRGRFTFAQLAAPSRTAIENYRSLDERVEKLAERINTRFGQGDWKPIRLLIAHHEPPAVFRYYRAADVCYVSSLHDGMNLVGKEFVAARDDERGVLVLSQFTGAARELTEALVVNPYDLDQAGAALAAAVDMPAGEQRERMRAMRAYIAEFNVYRWAGRMLVDAARLRRRERTIGRLSTHVTREMLRA